MADIVEVVAYDPAWPEAFRSERERILEVLGHRLLHLAHTGSTAVPGLSAKPTIDILAGVHSLEIDEEVISGLESLGYGYLGEYGIAGRHFFRKGSPPTHHVHWAEIDGPFWDVQLLHRDYMRAHPDDAHAYEALKQELAERYRHERSQYTASKGAFIGEMLDRARAWRLSPEVDDVLVVDLEATCWDKPARPDRQEIIEIGAVRVDPVTGVARDTFRTYVRPIENPVLSPFCLSLVAVTQAEVDGAPGFEEAFEAFLDWAGPGTHRLASWGLYDRKQLALDAERHRIPTPDVLTPHLNLRRLFAEVHDIDPCDVSQALARGGLSFEGQPHSGMDDARNIARLLPELLPAVRARGL